MSQRTFHLTGTVTDFSGSSVVGAPCSFQPLFPGGLLGAIDGNGAVVESAPVSFTTDAGGNLVLLDGTSPVLIDYPGDYQSAYQATQVQVTLNGQAYISPINFSYASSIAVSSWISAPVTTGLVTMRFVYTGDDNKPIVGALISITLIAPALVVSTGQQLSAAVPSQGLTDSSGTAYIALNPNSLLNPNNLGYGITAAAPDGTTEIIPWISVVPPVVDTYLGAWNSGTAYVAASGPNNGNVVTSGGVLYRCILGHTNHVPPNATYWVVVSGLPTDLLSAHATFSAQVGQMAVGASTIGAAENTPSGLHGSPVSVQDVLDDAIYLARHPTIPDATTSAPGLVEIRTAASGSHPVALTTDDLNAHSGVAPLDGAGHVPAANLSGIFSGEVSATDFAPSGLPGAVGASRFAGRHDGGHPTGGTFAAGDYTVDATSGSFWVCTAPGTPGTWIQAAALPDATDAAIGGVELDTPAPSGHPAVPRLTAGKVAPAVLPVFGQSGATHAPGAVPDPGPLAGNTKALFEDGVWRVPVGGGGGGGSLPFTQQGSQVQADAGHAAVELLLGRAHQAPSPIIGGAAQDVAWVTPTPAPGYVDRRSNDGDLAVRTIAAPGGGAILFIGDSNMAGGGIMTLPTPPDRAASKLSTLSGLSITAVNWGIGSSYTDNWLPGSSLAPAGWGGGTPILSLAIAGGKAAGARIAWVTIGTNDAYSTVNNSAVTYYAHLLAIVQNLAASGFTVFVGYMDYNRYTGAPYISTPNANYLAYQPYIDKLAIPGQVFVADTTLWLATKANTGTTGWYADNVHLDYNGEDYWAQVMAEAMLPAVLALYGQSTEQVIPKGANNTFFGVNGSGVQGYYPTPGGVSVTHKGDLQGHDTAPNRIPVSGHDGRVLTEDAGNPLGVSWQPPATGLTALASLTDVYLHNLQDADTFAYSLVLGQWVNSSAGFGYDVIDDTSGLGVVDGISGFGVVSDPLPTLVLNDGNNFVVVDDSSGAHVVAG